MKPDISAILKYQPRVKAALETRLKQSQPASANDLEWNEDVSNRLLTFATTGKLLRGCLVCYSYGLGSEAAPTSDVLDTAAALELMHSSLVIHDDIIDRDDIRRGRPAIHSQYRQLGGQEDIADPQRFGEAMALCAGDMTLFLGFGMLPNDGDLRRLFSQTLANVCAGQMADIHLGLSAVRPSKREIYAVMRAKTATYSVALPLAAGAILAGQPSSFQKRIYQIGLAAGIIFQIRDDELGAIGQTAELGKPVGADIREGKKTLLHYYLWQAASRSDRQYFKTIFGNPKSSPADIKTVQQALKHYGIPARLQQDVKQLEQTANRHIDQLNTNPLARDKLRQVISFCASRQF